MHTILVTAIFVFVTYMFYKSILVICKGMKFIFATRSEYKKVEETKVETIAEQPAVTTSIYVDFGPTVKVLGHTFVRDANNYYINEDKSVWFCQHKTSLEHFYGIMPSIHINRNEFLTHLGFDTKAFMI
jgi:hypothetical protein